MKWIAAKRNLVCAKLPLTVLLQDRLDVATTALHKENHREVRNNHAPSAT